jgi:hypothetical protein
VVVGGGLRGGCGVGFGVGVSGWGWGCGVGWGFAVGVGLRGGFRGGSGGGFGWLAGSGGARVCFRWCWGVFYVCVFFFSFYIAPNIVKYFRDYFPKYKQILKK